MSVAAQCLATPCLALSSALEHSLRGASCLALIQHLTNHRAACPMPNRLSTTTSLATNSNVSMMHPARLQQPDLQQQLVRPALNFAPGSQTKVASTIIRWHQNINGHLVANIRRSSRCQLLHTSQATATNFKLVSTCHKSCSISYCLCTPSSNAHTSENQLDACCYLPHVLHGPLPIHPVVQTQKGFVWSTMNS